MNRAYNTQQEIIFVNDKIKFAQKVINNKTQTLQKLLTQVNPFTTSLISNGQHTSARIVSNNSILPDIRVNIPKNTEIWIKSILNASVLFISGARGSVYTIVDKPVRLEQQGSTLLIKLMDSSAIAQMSWINNFYRAFVGVNRGYKKSINIIGVGYKSFLQDNNIFKLVLGYSHDTYYKLNEHLTVLLGRKNNKFIMRGSSLPLLTTTTASLHQFKKPDIYRGKGLRYRGIVLPVKEGKKKK